MVITTVIIKWLAAVAFVVAGPFVGMFIRGLDRKVTARMQGRVGPSIKQPLYDIKKLWAKEDATVNSVMDFHIGISLLFTAISGVIFFFGGNLFLAIFILTLVPLFMSIGAFSARSPFSDIGAEREIFQAMCYEPLMVLLPITMYMAVGSFDVSVITTLDMPMVVSLPMMFVAFLFILTIKLRKSPFDLSMSHHAHQEIVKGLSTEMSGKTFAVVELIECYETTLFYAMIAMFFITSAWWSWLVALAAIIVTFLIEVFIDNNFARVRWQTTLKWSWGVTLILFALNIALLCFI